MSKLQENIDDLKTNIPKKPRYILSNANVFVSNSGYHFIDYLDENILENELFKDDKIEQSSIDYIEKMLQYNKNRFDSHVECVNSYVDVKDKRILDVGCGGGLFLKMLKKQGAYVEGVELSRDRLLYNKQINKIDVVDRPVEDEFWIEHYGHYDVVTLWDVIEHVNFPYNTLKSCHRLLNSGGYLFIDTPCRNSFYHMFGELSYKLSKGMFPTFLNQMYSSHKFGHKQIFSTKELQDILEDLGFSVVKCKKFHELSFPYSYYLIKLLKNKYLVKAFEPIVSLFFSIFSIKNKMVIVAQKNP